MSSDVPPRGKGGKKLAGIPTKWWLIGGGGLALAYIYVQHKRTAAATTALTTTQDPTLDGSTDATYSGASSPIDTGSGYGTYFNSPPATSPVIATNADWYQAAVVALQANGYHATSIAAIGEYLLGLPLTPDQVATVQAAISLIGPPPQYVALHQVPAPPPSTVPATPTLSMAPTSGHRMQATASKVTGAAIYEFRYGNGIPHPQPSNIYISGAHAPGSHYGPLYVRAIGTNGKASAWSPGQTATIQ